MINTIIQFLNSRFESLDLDPVHAAGKIFDPRVWPESVEDPQGAHTSSVSVYVRNIKKCMEEY